MPTPQAETIEWLLKSFVDNTPDVWAAQLSSTDGLKIAGTLDNPDQADYISAIVAAHLPLFNINLRKVTGSSETFHEDTVVNCHDTLCFIVSAGEGGILCALTDSSADIGLVGHELNELVARVGEHLGVAPRGFQQAAAHNTLS